MQADADDRPTRRTEGEQLVAAGDGDPPLRP